MKLFLCKILNLQLAHFNFNLIKRDYFFMFQHKIQPQMAFAYYYSCEQFILGYN